MHLDNTTPPGPPSNRCNRKLQEDSCPPAFLDLDDIRYTPHAARTKGKVYVTVCSTDDFGVLAILVCSLFSKGARTKLAKRLAGHGVPDAEAAVEQLAAHVWEQTAT